MSWIGFADYHNVADFTMYAQWEKFDVTLSKEVTGDYGDKIRDYGFRVTVQNKDGTPYAGPIHYTLADGGTAYELPLTNGVGSLTLKHGQTAKFIDLPEDAKLSFAETDADVSAADRTAGYTATSRPWRQLREHRPWAGRRSSGRRRYP